MDGETSLIHMMHAIMKRTKLSTGLAWGCEQSVRYTAGQWELSRRKQREGTGACVLHRLGVRAMWIRSRAQAASSFHPPFTYYPSPHLCL